mgnify:CR=1 FL=1
MQVADLLGMGLRNKRALCIHHDDHHPSLAFNVKKNTCHCYSCGFSADTIGLVRERLNLGFSEACRWLADHFDVYIADEHRDTHRKDVKKAVTASDRRMAALREQFAETMFRMDIWQNLSVVEKGIENAHHRLMLPHQQ